MKMLKKIWEKCGDARLVMKVTSAVCTAITAIILFFWNNPPLLDALMVIFNGALVVLANMEDGND